jgi:hypothetical protein
MGDILSPFVASVHWQRLTKSFRKNLGGKDFKVIWRRVIGSPLLNGERLIRMMVRLVKKNKPAIKNGVMHKLYVYDSGALIGYGFLITYADGKMSQPELFDITGNKLPEGWYQLTMSNEHYNVVVPRNVQ